MLIIRFTPVNTGSGIYILTLSSAEDSPDIQSLLYLNDSFVYYSIRAVSHAPLILNTFLTVSLPVDLVDSFSFQDEVESGISYSLQSSLTFDHVLDSSQIYFDTLTDSLLLDDVLGFIRNLLDETSDLLDISDYTTIVLFVDGSSNLYLQDTSIYHPYELIISGLTLNVDVACLLREHGQSILQLNDDTLLVIFCSFRDLLDLLDIATPSQVLYDFVLSSLWLSDILGETQSAILEKALSLLIDFYYPQRFSFLDLDAINCSDTIFALQDGIYTLDLSSTSPSMVSLNLSELQSSRMKRIDKIYSNVPLSKAILYADNRRYNLLGNGKFISVPKGIRAKDYKLVIENAENVEFIDVALIEERRPK